MKHLPAIFICFLLFGNHSLLYAAPQAHPDDIFWNDRFTPPGIDRVDYPTKMQAYGSDLYVGGSFTELDGEPVNHLVRWNGSTWAPVSGGLTKEPSANPDDDGWVESMTVFENRLIVGGDFDHAGETPASNVAAWDGVEWGAFGTGFPGPVTCVADIDGVLHASTYEGIFAWSGSDWEAVGTNLSGVAYALVEYGADLFAAGGLIAGSESCDVARWSGSTWIPIAESNSGTTDALIYDGDLVISGWFEEVNGVPANRVARWNGVNWGPLSDGLIENNVEGLTVYGSRLIAHGWLTSSIGDRNIAEWDGIAWSNLGGGLSNNAFCFDAAVYNGDLCIVGDIDRAGDIAAWDLARWDGVAWHSMRSHGSLALSGTVTCLTSWQDCVVAGGNFTSAGDTAASGIAILRGDAWRPVGAGVNYQVNALVGNGPDLYAGGSFTTAGCAPALRVARWDGTDWSPVGDGFDNKVHALASWQGGIAAGGDFTMSGSTPVTGIALWDGSSWIPVGGGTNGSVAALTVHRGELIAGGSFTQAGGQAASRIARFDGASWQPMGDGMNGSVVCLLSLGTELIAGGWFSSADGVPAGRIARWNGLTWSPMGSLSSGVPLWGSTVTTLTVHDNQIVAGGRFTFPAKGIARWDGTNWNGFGSGVEPPPDLSGMPGPDLTTLASLSFSGALFLGGSFEEAGARPVRGMAEWHAPTTVGLPGDPWRDRTRVRVTASPNPFVRLTDIAYRLSESAPTVVSVHDASGRRLVQLVDEVQQEGSHILRWDGRQDDGTDLASGVYFVRLTTGGKTASTRVLLLRD